MIELIEIAIYIIVGFFLLSVAYYVVLLATGAIGMSIESAIKGLRKSTRGDFVLYGVLTLCVVIVVANKIGVYGN